MIKHLKFEVTFPTTGRVFTGEHDFMIGMTTITGPNEAGKSLRLEMIRFALFGSAALRATSEKYKKLSVELTWTLKETTYVVARSLTNARLSQDDGVICVGTKPVNAKIVELFGYGLPVFDTSHCVLQGQVEALGAMRPAERKRMVDQTVGLNVLDDLIKFTADQSLAYKREAEAFDEVLVQPIEPTQPEGYRSSEELKPELARLLSLVGERNQIQGWLQGEPPEPVPPEPCAVTETVAMLTEHQKRRNDVSTALQVARAKHDGIPDPTHTEIELDGMEEQLKAADLYLAYQRALAALPPRPIMTIAEIEEHETRNAIHTAWQKKHAAFDRHKVSCPNCAHSWAEGVEDPGPEPEQSAFEADTLKTERSRIRQWESAPSPVPVSLHPSLSATGIREGRQALARSAEKAKLRDEMFRLEIPPDRGVDLETRRSYEQAYQIFSSRYDHFETFGVEKVKKQARLAEIGDVGEDLELLQSLAYEAKVYEMNLARYGEDLKRFKELSEKITAARAKSTGYTQARQALADLKSMVKSHLVPSISRVSSILLGQMTGNKRSVIDVDEDFEIKVDGQDLEELSGSAKAVANLAVRLGLGAALTNRIFSVLLGDEIDAAMDQERAGYTGECLRNLKSKIAQIVLVSHKHHDADHYVALT